MAILQTDDKLLQDDQNPQGGGAQQPQLGGGESATVSAAGAGTGGSNTAGVGKGGTGSWTNIQSYLGANQGDTGTADYTQNKIGSQFNQEKTDLEKSANDTKAQAQSQSQKIVDTKKNADSLLNDATKTYDWSKSAQNYGQAGDQLRSGLYDQYSGPQNFSYGLSDKTQNYGTALNNADAFKSFLNNSYQERAGAPMSSGQLALQRQLDTTNDALAAKKQDLAGQYTGLQGTVDSTVKDTDSALVNSQRDYRNAQSDLGDYLRGSLNTTDSAIAQKEADARKGYNTDYTTGLSGRENAMHQLYDGGGWGGVQAGQARNRNMYADNATWEQLQNEKNNAGQNWSVGGTSGHFIYSDPDYNGQYGGNMSALDQFYNGEDQKFANTADADKIKYNALQDFLNGTDKKQQGFKVRG